MSRAGRPSRSRWFRLGAVLLPFAVLLLTEAALRLVGYGYPTAFLVRHPAAGPDRLVENQRFPWRFFPRTLARRPNPLVISPAKPPGACRILVLGESAAEGDPAPSFSFARILEVLLRERYPGTRFEVVNTSFTAINSHVIVPIARDCRQLRADFWLIYMGNNEVVGPFGAGTVFGSQSPPRLLLRASLALKTTRTGQLLDALVQRVRPNREAAGGWGGMTMFLDRQVRKDDPQLPGLRARFQANLREIIDLGTRAGARVVVSTMASRLRDWPPFASRHRADLTEPQWVEWEKLYQAGAAAEASGDLPAALHNYAQAAHLDPDFADLHFRWGRCCLAAGQIEEGRAHLTLARDLDTLRFRADSQLNELIRQTVASPANDGTRLVDAERLFERSSTNGVPGAEWFHEHVHFTFAGNYQLARLFADAVAAALPTAVAPGPGAGDWLPEAACAERLAYTDSQRYEIANLIRRRFEEPIYRQQLDHAERLNRVEQEMADLRGAARPAGRSRALTVCRRALALAPDDWILHELTARLLGGLDDRPAAEVEWRQVARLIPHAAMPHTEIGKLQLQQGNADHAATAFRQAIALNPDFAEAYVGLGNACAHQGREPQAIRSFQKAIELDPTRTEAADALSRLSPGSKRRRRVRRVQARMEARGGRKRRRPHLAPHLQLTRS